MKVTKEQFIGMTYDELLAENEKLWVLNEHMGLKDMAVIGGLEKENERLKSDNAKLRELVQDMWFWHYEGHIDGESQERQMKHIDGVLDRMRELGVEVDE